MNKNTVNVTALVEAEECGGKSGREQNWNLGRGMGWEGLREAGEKDNILCARKSEGSTCEDQIEVNG